MAPVIIENFIDRQLCSKVVEWIKSSDKWEPGIGEWDARCINFGNMPLEIQTQIVSIYENVKNVIKQNFGCYQDIHADIFQFVRWRTGDKLYPPHADAENLDGSPHPYAYRKFASIIYLNDEYEGGEIYFPNFNLVPKINVGTLVTFPSTLEYLHGVNEITNGTRYTIAGFFTYEQQYASQYSLKDK